MTNKNAKITALETDLATEKDAHLATQQINAALQEQIEALEQAAKKPAAMVAKVTKVPDTSFKVDKVDYVITVPAFHYGNTKITAEQLLSDKKMQQELVAAGVGFIKRKGDK